MHLDCTSHAFQNASHLNATLLRFSKWQPFECTSIVPGHACQNASPLKLNAPLLCQVMLLKMPAL
jgi:hypothetical protein